MYIPERRLEHIDNELERLNLRLHSKPSEGSIDNGNHDPHCSVQLLICSILDSNHWRGDSDSHLYMIMRNALTCYFCEKSMIASTALVLEGSLAPPFASI